jgi:hypothetical protein
MHPLRHSEPIGRVMTAQDAGAVGAPESWVGLFQEFRVPSGRQMVRCLGHLLFTILIRNRSTRDLRHSPLLFVVM